MIKQSFDFVNQQWVENIYFTHYNNDVEMILINNNDLIHSQDKYNYIMDITNNYMNKITKSVITSGVYLNSWMDYQYSLEFIRNISDLTFVKNEKIICHQDGHVLINNNCSLTNNKNNFLILLQFTKQNGDYKYKILYIPIDTSISYQETNISLNELLFDTTRFLNTFGELQGVKLDDKLEEKIFKLFQWLYRNIESFTSYISNLLENLKLPILEYFTYQYIKQNQHQILNQLMMQFDTNYLIDKYTVNWAKTFNDNNVIFGNVDKNFYFVGYKNNYDALILNNDIGIIYIIPLFISMYNSLELMYKEVIINIDESIMEKYIPKTIEYMINLKLFNSISFRY